MAAGLAVRALRRPTRWARVLTFPYSRCRARGRALRRPRRGILCSLTACLRNILIAWVVLMPSSEKSFAASSLVCLSMRTVTLTVFMRISLPRVCAMRRLYARQAACSWNPSWRDGYPSRGDRECAVTLLPYTKIAPMVQCAMGAI